MRSKSRNEYILLLLMMVSAACTSNNDASLGQSSVSVEGGSKPNQTVTFRQGCDVGERFTTIGRAEFIVSEEREPAIMQGKSVSELVKVDGGLYTWKTTTSMEFEELGTHRMKEGATLDKNRIEFLTTNSFGNRVSAEGEEPDASQTFNQYPEKSVRIGDSWNGYSLEKGRRYKNTYTLEDLVKIKGKEYAIVSFDNEEKGGFSRGKFWFELSKGNIHKEEAEIKSENDDGKMVRIRYVSHVVDNNNKKILP